MFRFLFTIFDTLSKCMTEFPGVVGMFFTFLFLGGIVAISLWEVPVHRVSEVSGNILPDCAFRTRSMTLLFLPSGSQSKRTLASDMCGEEARVWSKQTASKQKQSFDGELSFPENLLNTEIAFMTAGYPIERMAPAIAKYDREVAALIVGIAKKESNWGRRVPRSGDGADCFNYWGFKGAGSRGVAMGHGCFGSPEEAVEKVGNRIAELVQIRSTSEPKNFTIWKCGSSCSTHSDESVRKWVSDVDQYYRVLAIRY
jgi:hypothetical protein